MISAGTTHTSALGAPSRTGARALIASDIDGTLLVTGQAASPAIIEAIAALRDAGHHLILATGRSLAGALAAARELRLTDGWLVASNGAVVARLSGGSYTLLQVRTIDAEAVVRTALRSMPHVRVAVEIVGVGYHVNEQFPATELNGDQVRVARLGDLWAEATPRVVVYGPDTQRLVPEFRAAGMTAIATWSDWVDVTVGGVSKATAVEHLRQDLDVPIGRTMAIGDGENDIELLQWAWRGVAMGHATPQVQGAADEVTGSIEQSGAVGVLRSLLTTSPPEGYLRSAPPTTTDLGPLSGPTKPCIESER